MKILRLFSTSTVVTKQTVIFRDNEDTLENIKDAALLLLSFNHTKMPELNLINRAENAYVLLSKDQSISVYIELLPVTSFSDIKHQIDILK